MGGAPPGRSARPGRRGRLSKLWDKKWTAQFEHTTVVTDTGAEILTMS
ncbi:hypothetical protein SAMN05661093_10921 [Kibdelosporangium aridum]|uniref:Type I methionyl aminopeptidase n=1 Tax=Kibdelosporangium aridum TaxID=2030 RepID=A0A1W2G0A6_KIBAR|nr:hypothetical protein SAMN05661093_10921 [Kibdelosporangium aridum]